MNTLIVTRGDAAALVACCEYLMSLSASGQPYRVHYAVDGLICLAAPHSITLTIPQQAFLQQMGYRDAAEMQAALLATANAVTYCRTWAEVHEVRPDLLSFDGNVPRTASTPAIVAEALAAEPPATILTV